MLTAKKISYAQAAKELNVSKAYIGAWARGYATPALKKSYEIRDWAKKKGGRVSVESWEDFVQ